DEQVALYRALAAEKGLLIGAGSDSHAPHQPVNPRPWRAIWAAELLARLGVTVAPPEEGPVWEPGMPDQPPPPAPAELEPDAKAPDATGRTG
ncbi:MAG: hypothetical protein KC432_13135, partial [Thermomicrobiales bacterium]|nr:hypothetical protein [Thermomicrobiales bacterium]